MQHCSEPAEALLLAHWPPWSLWPTQLLPVLIQPPHILPEAGVLLAQALPAPGGLEVHEEQEEEAARLRSRSPSSLVSAL